MTLIFLSRIFLIGFFITSVNGFVDGSVTHVTGCQDNWVAFDGSCYFFGHSKTTFTEAAHFCQSHSSHLVHVDSSSENAFIKDHVKYVIGNLDRWWIGLTDEIIEGDWRWLDTDNHPTYADWGPGEPNNDRDTEDCAVLEQNAWNDIPCSQSNRPICEKRKV